MVIYEHEKFMFLIIFEAWKFMIRELAPGEEFLVTLPCWKKEGPEIGGKVNANIKLLTSSPFIVSINPVLRVSSHNLTPH